MKAIAIFLILCIFVGGASANTISFNAVTNVITVIGFNATHPCTFLDVYNADVAGGWGVVNAMLPNQFHLSAKLFIGDGVTTTWFEDINKFIFLNSSIIAGGNIVFIEVATNATIRLGERLVNTSTTSNGCAIYIPSTTSNVVMIYLNKGRCDLYNCYLSYEGARNKQCIVKGVLTGSFIDPIPILNVYNTICSRVQLENVIQADIYNVYISEGEYAITTLSPNINYVKLDNTIGSALQLYRLNGDLTMKNLKIKSTYLYTPPIRADIMTGDAFLVDCEIDRWIFFWSRAPLPNVFRQYTFNLQTTPNAEIIIMNHTDIVYQDYAYDNGSIAEQILTMGYYKSTTGNTLNSYNPYSIEIKRKGYHTYAQKFTLNDPIRWHIMLLPDRVQVGSNIIRPARRS